MIYDLIFWQDFSLSAVKCDSAFLAVWKYQNSKQWIHWYIIAVLKLWSFEVRITIKTLSSVDKDKNEYVKLSCFTSAIISHLAFTACNMHTEAWNNFPHQFWRFLIKPQKIASEILPLSCLKVWKVFWNTLVWNYSKRCCQYQNWTIHVVWGDRQLNQYFLELGKIVLAQKFVVVKILELNKSNFLSLPS